MFHLNETSVLFYKTLTKNSRWYRYCRERKEEKIMWTIDIMWQVKNCQQKCMFVSLLQLVATHFIRLSIRSFASLLLKTFLHRHPKEFSRTTKPFVKQKIGMQKSLKGDKVHFKKSIVVTSGIWVTNTTQAIHVKWFLMISK